MKSVDDAAGAPPFSSTTKLKPIPQNGGHCGKFRIGVDKTVLDGIPFARQVEVETREGTWVRHPSVFLAFGSYAARASRDPKFQQGVLAYFTPSGELRQVDYKPKVHDAFIRNATKNGLCKGYTTNRKLYASEHSESLE